MKRTKPFSWRELREVQKPDKLNKEGFPTYTRSIEEDVVNVLMTGSTANAFYVNAREKVDDIISVLDRCEDLEFLAKAAVYAREQGYMREMPIVALVMLSKKDKELFRRIVGRICRNPHDWQRFIDISRAGLIRKGVGRALKSEINKAIAGMPVYHAIKYPTAVKDMIRIARPHESVNPVVTKYIMENKHEGNEQLEALDRLKHAADEEEVIQHIKEGKLPYEVVVGSVKKMTPKIWEALLYQAPYFNMLRNLNNFIRNGVFDDEGNLEYVIRKLTDKDAVRKNMLFPFRYYIAHRMLIDFKYRHRLRNALEKAMEISVDNVPELQGKVAIASDVSYSMSSSMTGDYSVVQCCDVVGVFTATFVRKCKELPVVLPFDIDVREDIAAKVYASETMMQVAKCFRPYGGTSLSAPVEWLLKKKEKVDYFIAFTDNEEWVGRSFIEALEDYLRFNPEVKVYLVTLLPYRDYPVPQQYRNVHFVFGWSDSVLKYIASDTAEQVEEVKAVSLYR